MQFIRSLFLICVTAIMAASARPTPQSDGEASTINSLIPDYGIEPGIPSASQPGSCQGANNVNIPCQCPPNRDLFIQQLQDFDYLGDAFGSPVVFSTDLSDMSIQTQLNRIDACIVTLQNFDNLIAGVGCPAASAPNFGILQANLLQQL